MSYIWIDNQSVTGTGEPYQVRAPWSGELLVDFNQASSTQIDAAIASSERAFPGYAQTPLYQRCDWLLKLVELLANASEELAKLIAQEAAKPIRDARGEVFRAIATFRLAAEETVRSGDGEYLNLDRTAAAHGRSAIVKHFPRGVILGITPFNFPLNLVAHKVAPALAAGCTIVLKPAPQTPLTALRLAELVAKAGFPPGVLQVIPCDGKTIEPFVSDPRIKFVSFTGSALVGWKLRKLADVPVALELGGNGAVLIDETADLEFAVKRCLIGAYSYAGQVCISVQRIFVVETRYQEFIKRFKDAVNTLQLGNPLDERSDFACLISEAAAIRVEEWIAEAKAGGASILVRGNRVGNRLGQSLLIDVPHNCRLAQEEVFGPVCWVAPVSDWKAGINAIEDSKYGLQAGYFTTDLKRVLAAFEQLHVGGLIAGDIPTFREDSYPYGGVKLSGSGREGVRFAMQEMMELRTLVLPAQ